MVSRREFLGKAAASGMALWWGGRTRAQEKPAEAPQDADVTAEWAKLYANPKAQPGTTYRAGHVTASKEKAAREAAASGYSLQMPSGAPIPTPAVDKGRLFVSGGFHSKQYFCFEAATGKPVWAVDLDDDGPSTAAVEDDLVVVNTESCTIFTLEASTGKMVWSLWLGDPLMTAPAIARGRVFTAYPADGRAHHKEASHLVGAFDLKSGKILWQRWIDGDVISAPVAAGEELVVATFTGTVYRFKQETGELLSAIRARATSAPVVEGKELHFSRRTEKSGGAEESLAVWERGDRGTGAAGGYRAQVATKSATYLDRKVQDDAELKKSVQKLDAANGFAGGAPETAKAQAAAAIVGQSNVATLQSYQGSRILRHGANSIACMGDEVVCSDPRDGKKLWSLKLKGDLAKQGGYLGAPPVAAGESLFMSTLAGAVLRIDPRTGEVKRTWELGHPMRYPPVVDGGRVFVGTHDGRVVAIETGDAKDTGWPQWGANAQRTGTAAK